MRLYSILESLRRAATNDHPWISTPPEAGVLVAEMERLRVERDHCHRAMEFANAEAERMRGEVERERAAVVKWLRRMSYAGALDIERGEHRREEEP
jgi:hypothetical protein